jgi:hypothetical protein
VDAVGADRLFAFTVVYFCPCLLASALLVFVPMIASLSLLYRIFFSYGTFFLSLSFFAFLISRPVLPPDWILLLVVGVIGLVDGLAQSSILSMGAHNETHMRQILLGNAIAGLAVSMLKITGEQVD